MPTINCSGDVHPDVVQCVDRPVDLTVQLEAVNDVPESLRFFFEVRIDSAPVGSGQVDVGPNQSTLFSHTVTVAPPAEDRSFWFTCDREHQVETVLVDTEEITPL